MRKIKDINVHIGIQIRKARETAGYTQEQLSELIQMSAKNLSAIERGVAGISLEALQRVCKVLSISSDSLIMDDVEDCDVDKLDFVTLRLKRLTKKNFDFAYDILNSLFMIFASQDDDK